MDFFAAAALSELGMESIVYFTDGNLTTAAVIYGDPQNISCGAFSTYLCLVNEMGRCVVSFFPFLCWLTSFIFCVIQSGDFLSRHHRNWVMDLENLIKGVYKLRFLTGVSEPNGIRIGSDNE